MPDKPTSQEVPLFGNNEMFSGNNLHRNNVLRGISKIKMLFTSSRTLKDLVVVSAASISVFALAAISGLLNGVEEWERKNSLSNYHVEAFAILLMVLGIATSIFLLRRYQEIREESLSRAEYVTDTSLVEPQPALQYEELENLFRRVESAKKEWQLSLDSIRDMVILSDLDGTIHRCNRTFRDFIGLPYAEILRENIASLLTKFEIDMKGLDLKALNARFHISGKWFGVRSYPYTDFETANITRVVIIILEVPARRATEDKVQFVWGHKGHSRLDDSQANP